MKHYIFFALLAFFAAGLAISWKAPAAADAPEVVYVGEDGAQYEPTASGIVRYTFTLDTITDAENDTLSFPYNVFSSYSSLYQITRTNISGTTNVAVTLQQSAVTSGNTDWVTVATTSATTATNEALTLNPTYGVRYRLIVDGSGTQNTSYRITAVLKKL